MYNKPCIVMGLKILRAQHGPGQVDEQSGGDESAQREVQHGALHPLAGRNVENEQPEEGQAGEYRNKVTHVRKLLSGSS
jgi:hypothetical protein